MVDLVDSSRWATLIGRMFIAFGNIERTTHECIRDWAGDQIHKHFAKARLSARIELARDLACSQDASPMTKDAFSQSLTRAKNLAKYRNLVAHNPLCLMLLQESLSNPFLEVVCHINDDSQYLSYEELSEIVTTTEDCAEKLLHQYIAFRVEKLDTESLSNFPGLNATSV